MKMLRNGGLFTVHLAIAVFGTTLLSLGIGKAIHPRSVTATATMAWLLTTLVGVALGFIVYRTWRWKPAVWVWVPLGLVFALVLVTTRSAPGGSWYWISGLACGQGERIGCMDFGCALVFLSSAAYSTGSLLGARLFA